ncbi:MAG: ribosomal subunit interface protein [Planctomycetota bacterium]
MEIHIRKNGVDADEVQIEAQIEKELDRFAERLTSVDLHLRDENAQKGGRDTRCTIEARPRGGDPIAVDELAMNAKDAVPGALGKLVRTLDSRFGKLDDARR